jgi:hypothetical protein
MTEQKNTPEDEFVKSLPENEKEKLEAISQALHILSEAKVPVCMFPLIPSFNYHDVPSEAPVTEVVRKYIVSQYSNYRNFVKNDENDSTKLTKKSMVDIGYINCSLTIAFINYFIDNMLPKDFKQEEVLPLLAHAYDVGIKWVNQGITPQEVIDAIK